MLLCITISGKQERKVNLSLFIAHRMALSPEGKRPGVMVRIATLAVALSLCVMLISLSVMMGFKQEISRKVVGFTAHIDLLDIRSRHAATPHPISVSEGLDSLLQSHTAIRSIAPYATKGGIIKTRDAMLGVQLKGVDAAYDWNFFEELLVAGDLPRVGDEQRTKDLLLSRTVAEKLQVGVGDKIEMLFLEEEGAPRRDRFKVSGIYHSGMEELDNLFTLTDIRNVQRLLGWDSATISGYEIRLHKGEDPAAVARELNSELFYSGADRWANLVASDLLDRYPTIFDWLKTHDVNAAVILGIMLIVALFNMTSVLLILVLERTRMIGLLKALGMGNQALRKIFLYRGGLIILHGLAWGNGVALALCLAQRYGHWIKLDASGYLLSEVPIALDWSWWLGVNFGAALLILLLLILPTGIIARIRPEESIRYE